MYFSIHDIDLIIDFHTYLPDSTDQSSTTVYNHITKLVEHLKKVGLLKEGVRITNKTDGCAHQCWSATALYFILLLLRQEKIIIYRAISCTRNGKNIFDGLSEVKKYISMGTSIRSFKNANETDFKLLNAAKV